MEAVSLHPGWRPMPRMTLGYCPRREVMRVVVIVVIIMIISIIINVIIINVIIIIIIIIVTIMHQPQQTRMA